MKWTLVLLLMVAAIVPAGAEAIGGTAGGGGTAAPAPPGISPVMMTAPALQLEMQMHMLWAYHGIYLRCVIIDLAADLPAVSGDRARLMQNEAALGNALKPYYGDAIGDQLTGLLQTGVALTGAVVLAAKSDDATATQAALDRWYANADETALFLSAQNPQYWPQEKMKKLLRAHLDTTRAEAVARLTGDWPGDTASFDRAFEQIMGMANSLAEGLVRQFPDKFK